MPLLRSNDVSMSVFDWSETGLFTDLCRSGFIDVERCKSDSSDGETTWIDDSGKIRASLLNKSNLNILFYRPPVGSVRLDKLLSIFEGAYGYVSRESFEDHLAFEAIYDFGDFFDGPKLTWPDIYLSKDKGHLTRYIKGVYDLNLLTSSQSNSIKRVLSHIFNDDSAWRKLPSGGSLWMPKPENNRDINAALRAADIIVT